MSSGTPEIIGSGLGFVALCGAVYWKMKGSFVSKDTCEKCQEASNKASSELKDDIKYVRGRVDELISLHLERKI